jgi:ABC-type phosphate transport system ATPase subunit
MKDTNAIEQALKDKCTKEISQVVNVFINELEAKIRGEYNSSNYYDFIGPNGNGKANFHVMGTEQMRNVLFRMISNAHLEGMITVKSKELIKKLELV